jgi:hypothetical protein
MTRIQNPNTLGACLFAKGKRRMTTRSKQYHIDFSTFSNTTAIIQDISLLPSCIDSVYCVSFDVGFIPHKAIGGGTPTSDFPSLIATRQLSHSGNGNNNCNHSPLDGS